LVEILSSYPFHSLSVVFTGATSRPSAPYITSVKKVNIASISENGDVSVGGIWYCGVSSISIQPSFGQL